MKTSETRHDLQLQSIVFSFRKGTVLLRGHVVVRSVSTAREVGREGSSTHVVGKGRRDVVYLQPTLDTSELLIRRPVRIRPNKSDGFPDMAKRRERHVSEAKLGQGLFEDACATSYAAIAGRDRRQRYSITQSHGEDTRWGCSVAYLT